MSQRVIKVGTICYMVRARIHPEVIGDLVTVLSTLKWSEIWQQSYYEISKPAHAPQYRKFFARPVCLRPINNPDPTLSSTTAALGDAVGSIEQLLEKVNHG